MNNYIKHINGLVELFDNAEEDCVNINVILDANIAYDLTKELEFLGKEFFIEIDDQHEIELEKADNGILSVALSVYDDGEVQYFLQPALYDGVVIKEDGEFLDVACIQNELLDVIEPDKNFNNVSIAILNFSSEDYESDSCDCNICEECGELECECICDEDSDRGFVAEFIDEEIDEVLENLENGECVYCVLKEAMRNVYKLGYEMGLVSVRDNINTYLGE